MIALLASAIQAQAQEGPAVAADEAVDGGIGEIVVTVVCLEKLGPILERALRGMRIGE
jgi:hypothetical protein